MNIEFDRDELYNDFIQTYSDESHEEIIERIDLIEFILKYDTTRDLNFLKSQDLEELIDIKETTRQSYLKIEPKVKSVDDFDLDTYIDFNKIVDDFELDSGDLSPEDFYKLHEIFETFITTNKNENQFRR
jgi:hypothetical protein